MGDFKLISEFKPNGDQPKAISELYEGIKKGNKYQTLLGVTGSGKTYTVANIIEKYNRPTLVISPNKTLAAQLYSEFKSFFPENAVEYFVSYYDYYQPEAYLPHTDTYIEKDVSINEELTKMRHSATAALLSRSDCIIVASVSCIYGLGSPETYKEMGTSIRKKEQIDRDDFLRKLVSMQYERDDSDFKSGTFRARGDVVELFPLFTDYIVRVEFFGDEITNIRKIHPINFSNMGEIENIYIYPASHYLIPEDTLGKVITEIQNELEVVLADLNFKGKLIEAHRIETRTKYDIEMMQEMGYCKGIENYSRYFSGRKAGEKPDTLINYFPKDFLLIIDESHITVPQIRGMYEGDRSRKETLVNFGFRLPSALDNRPLKYNEFEALLNQVIFVSATPADYELSISEKVVEQIVRPTGLIDPVIIVRKREGQIDDLVSEVKRRIENSERTLVLTLTKRMAEDLTDYLLELGINARYLHSEIDTLERVKLLSELRAGTYDCLVGINLLREGLDLPEVSLIAILDADKEGYLRSTTSLIQIMGRVARNVSGTVIMYADTLTSSMKKAIDETERRRKIQNDYNVKNNIIPQTIKKKIDIPEKEQEDYKIPKDEDPEEYLAYLHDEMIKAANNLDFEKAAYLRDRIKEISIFLD
ncbi:MAG: excinuclease ABC subunit B [Candidatus Methanofastidiosum methylothiophilum]|uniref:UvrABC system protein B n=1 Tax=Candidatus Methanofastidiosum methylothiophilum TaxID=1705564 RepID=A0A150JDB3_9EURY|nr:MAG: excinuclease ABC subunit B [Candidatus Methanofastidiosum methylthiophilus]OQC52228.1 MAG: excinuclease ABC subunit B [Euryarchaeota archaeon ADurb.Bin023]HNV93742.1 excinuclease ABC subunit UvrB [Methanofastidiosum sp.]KYC56987.1 MAG: excinuclease ABC subunit B [Candidatus Methanofastidiosum methylthiophilus]KYC57990.1 MAG: excinuclease ABC subunit B [Candidatus Methanofastidiosum methylthiophilus]